MLDAFLQIYFHRVLLLYEESFIEMSYIKSVHKLKIICISEWSSLTSTKDNILKVLGTIRAVCCLNVYLERMQIVTNQSFE